MMIIERKLNIKIVKRIKVQVLYNSNTLRNLSMIQRLTTLTFCTKLLRRLPTRAKRLKKRKHVISVNHLPAKKWWLLKMSVSYRRGEINIVPVVPIKVDLDWPMA